MPGWLVALLVVGALAALPFYAFVLSKVWEAGRLTGAREFMRRYKGEGRGTR